MKSIRHIATLYYYDGPQVFEAGDGNGGRYIAVMVEPDAGQDQYLVAKVEPERLQQFRLGTLDLRSLLTERDEEEWFLAKANGGLDAPLALQPQQAAVAASSYLPEPGFLLHSSPANPDAVLGHAGLDTGCANDVKMGSSRKPVSNANEAQILKIDVTSKWGVDHFVWLVSEGNPAMAVRFDNEEARAVKDLKASAEMTWQKVIPTVDNVP